MRRRGQLVTGLQQMVGQKVRKEVSSLITTGEIVRLSGRTAYVKVDGSVGIKPADVYIDAQAGDRCVLTRPSEQHHWMVTGKLNPNAQPVPEFNPSNYGELSPPGSFQALSAVPGCCVWTWSVPAQKPVAFELQYNTAADASGATTGPLTRGAYFFVGSEDTLYARVRSVGPHYQKSAWSAWVSCVPGAGSGGGGGNVIYYNGGGLEIADTTTETSIFDDSAATGSRTFPANAFALGNIYTMLLHGEMMSDVVTPGTLTIRFVMGPYNFTESIDLLQSSWNAWQIKGTIMPHAHDSGSGNTSLFLSFEIDMYNEDWSDRTTELFVTRFASVPLASSNTFDLTFKFSVADADINSRYYHGYIARLGNGMISW